MEISTALLQPVIVLGLWSVVMMVVTILVVTTYSSIVKNLTMTREIVMLKEEQHKKDHILMGKLKSNKSETCDVCHGSGAAGDGTCPSCNGKGII